MIFFNALNTKFTNYKEKYVFRLADQTHLYQSGRLRSKLLTKAHIETVKYLEIFPYRFRRTEIYQDKWIHQISNCFVDPITREVYLSKNRKKKLIEFTGSFSRSIHTIGNKRRLRSFFENIYFKFYFYFKNREKQSSTEPLTLIDCSTYFHWIFEILPSCRDLYSYTNNIKFIVDKPLPSWAIQSFEYCLGIDIKSISVMPQFRQVNDFIFVTKNQESGPISFESIRFLRNATNSIKNSDYKYIYISRKKATTRKPQNEDVLIDHLQKLNFTILNLEDHSFADQISYFKGAEIIVGMHGAGLSGLFACQEGCKIIELFPPFFLHYCYANLAYKCKLIYNYLQCSGTTANFYVDQDILRKIEVLASLN